MFPLSGAGQGVTDGKNFPVVCLTYTVRPRVPAARHRAIKAELIRMASFDIGLFSAMLCSDLVEQWKWNGRAVSR